jgi:hypothetical protein
VNRSILSVWTSKLRRQPFDICEDVKHEWGWAKGVSDIGTGLGIKTGDENDEQLPLEI